MPRNQPHRPRHNWPSLFIVAMFIIAAIVAAANYAKEQQWQQYRLANSCRVTGYGIQTTDGVIHRITAEHALTVTQWVVLTEYTCSNNGQTIWR